MEHIDFSGAVDLSNLRSVPPAFWPRLAYNRTVQWQHIKANPLLPWPLRLKARFAEFEPPENLSSEELDTLAEGCCPRVVLAFADRFNFGVVSRNNRVTLALVLRLVRRKKPCTSRLKSISERPRVVLEPTDSPRIGSCLRRTHRCLRCSSRRHAAAGARRPLSTLRVALGSQALGAVLRPPMLSTFRRMIAHRCPVPGSKDGNNNRKGMRRNAWRGHCRPRCGWRQQRTPTVGGGKVLHRHVECGASFGGISCKRSGYGNR
jgi:hypothetical protein